MLNPKIAVVSKGGGDRSIPHCGFERRSSLTFKMLAFCVSGLEISSRRSVPRNRQIGPAGIDARERRDKSLSCVFSRTGEGKLGRRRRALSCSFNHSFQGSSEGVLSEGLSEDL